MSDLTEALRKIANKPGLVGVETLTLGVAAGEIERLQALVATQAASDDDAPMRDMLAIECKLTVSEAWAIWTGRPIENMGVRSEREGFWDFYAILRYEYADAMLKQRKSNR